MVKTARTAKRVHTHILMKEYEKIKRQWRNGPKSGLLRKSKKWYTMMYGARTDRMEIRYENYV